MLGDQVSYIGKVLSILGHNLDSLFSKKRLLHEVPDENIEFNVRTVEALLAEKRNKLSPKALSAMWRIGLKAAKRTLKVNTHSCIRTTGNLMQHFKTDKAHLRYKWLATREGNFYVNMLFTKIKSVRGYTCGNLYTTSLGSKKFFPMENKIGRECAGSLQTLTHLVGIPPSLCSDNAPEFIQGEFRKKCYTSNRDRALLTMAKLQQRRYQRVEIIHSENDGKIPSSTTTLVL